MSKRLFTLLNFILVAAFALSACAPAAATKAPTVESPAAAETPTPGGTPTAEPVTISFWEQEDADVDIFIDQLIADFEAVNPNIRIKRTHYKNDALRNQFQAAAQTNSAPDVARVPNGFIGDFAVAGLVAPANRLFGPTFFSEFFPEALKPAIVKETLYGVPDNYGDHLMLIYNKSLMPEPPATFDDLISKAKELTKGNIQGFAYNLTDPLWGAGFYGAFGGWPLDQNDQPQLDNQAFVDYLTFVKNLGDEGVVSQNCNFDCADKTMKDGTLAMIINDDQSLNAYAAALDDKLGVAPVPPIKGKPYAEMTGGKYFIVSKAVLDDTARKDAVMKFIAYMTSADVQLQWLDQYNRLPSNAKAAKDPGITTDPVLSGSMAALENGRGMPAALEMNCIWEAWRPNLESVMAGTLTPKDAAASAQKSADDCVANLGQQTPAPTP